MDMIAIVIVPPLILIGYLVFVLWIGGRIVRKAGLAWPWTLFLLVPMVNVVMIWVFAFCRWPAVDGPPPAPYVT